MTRGPSKKRKRTCWTSPKNRRYLERSRFYFQLKGCLVGSRGFPNEWYSLSRVHRVHRRGKWRGVRRENKKRMYRIFSYPPISSLSLSREMVCHVDRSSLTESKARNLGVERVIISRLGRKRQRSRGTKVVVTRDHERCCLRHWNWILAFTRMERDEYFSSREGTYKRLLRLGREETERKREREEGRETKEGMSSKKKEWETVGRSHSFLLALGQLRRGSLRDIVSFFRHRFN